MSVNKSDRTDKSELCYLAEQAEYKIIKMTMNEKYFPKRARFIITRQRRKLKKLKNKLDRGEIEFADIRQSYASWKGSLKGKKCYKTIQSMDELFNKLFINDWRLNYEY